MEEKACKFTFFASFVFADIPESKFLVINLMNIISSINYDVKQYHIYINVDKYCNLLSYYMH